MAITLLPLCNSGQARNKDGWSGAFAKVFLPFYGYLFATGEKITGTAQTLPQDQSVSFTGVKQSNTYQKGPGICL